jgi:catechol-2,3-dioxygenase
VDRPRESWPRGPTGAIAMMTEPLDLTDLVAELDR